MLVNPNTDKILSAVKYQSKCLIEGLDKLTPNQWDSPSRCHMWAIKDVVSHLVAINGFFLNSINQSLEGVFLPSHGMPNPGTGNAAEMSDGIASRAIQMSETTLSRQTDAMDALTHLEDVLITTWQQLDETQWDMPAYHPVNQLSPNLILELKLMEIILHSWDIFNSIDTTYQISKQNGILLCDVWKNEVLNRWLFTPDPSQHDPIQIELKLGTTKSMQLITYDSNLILTDQYENGDSTDTVINISPENLALVITARNNIEDLLDTKQAHIEGIKDKAQLFHHWFRGS